MCVLRRSETGIISKELASDDNRLDPVLGGGDSAANILKILYQLHLYTQVGKGERTLL